MGELLPTSQTVLAQYNAAIKRPVRHDSIQAAFAAARVEPVQSTTRQNWREVCQQVSDLRHVIATVAQEDDFSLLDIRASRLIEAAPDPSQSRPFQQSGSRRSKPIPVEEADGLVWAASFTTVHQHDGSHRPYRPQAIGYLMTEYRAGSPIATNTPAPVVGGNLLDKNADGILVQPINELPMRLADISRKIRAAETALGLTYPEVIELPAYEGVDWR